MSDDSISYGEDKENLLYINKKLNIQGFGLEEDNYLSVLEPEVSSDAVAIQGSEADLIPKDVGPKTFQNPKVTAKLRPFQLKWSYGMNANVGIKNLTNDTRREIFFSACHTAVLYNYCTKEMRHLEGHHHLITSISCDSSGRWIVTADSDPDGVIIFWDGSELKPVYTLFNLYPESGVLAIELSPCARYVLTIGVVKDQYQIDFWPWTLGEDKPLDSATINMYNSGSPVKICFDVEIEEHIMIVFQKQVYLFTWHEDKGKLTGPYIPQLTHRNKIGLLTSGTYIHQSHASYASSSRGCILIFRHSLHSKAYEEGEVRNDKVFINAVKVTNASIGVITTTDGILVVGDSKGHIYFFDYRVRILYWLRQFYLAAITSISFNPTPKEYEYVDDRIVVKCRSLDDNIAFDCENSEYKDVSDEITKICSEEVPFDASLKNNPFLVRDFFVSTSYCNIYAINFLSNICTPLFHVADDNVSAIEIHDEKPYMIIGYENGRLSIIDYKNNEKICKCLLPKTHDDHGETYDKTDGISCLRYSPESLHLVCGRNNGEIWILEPITLNPKIDKPYRHTRNKVVDIAFSSNSLQFAYYDNNRTVVLFIYDTEKFTWEYKGKVRSHYAPISDLKFSPNVLKSTLCSIGEDRHMIQYNNLRFESEQFGVLNRERIEQFSTPTCFVYYSKVLRDKIIDYFLIADNRGKLKLVHEPSKVPRAAILGPAYGCFKGSPIKKMKILPDKDFRYMVFLCKKHIGLHLMPPDGNPYKYTGYLAHPEEIQDFVVSHDGKNVFTFGKDDRCILMWEVLPRSVEFLHVLGGKELEPFYCLLEGGKNGWLFQEIQDLFFYMQILKQEIIDLPRRVSDNIPLSELPDLVRACGFYPSDFELETMLIDIKYRDFDESGTIREEISFIEFVKLYINHRPAYGYSLHELKRNFDILAKMAENPRLNKIETIDFVYILENSGETSGMLQKQLATLMRTKYSVPKGYDFLPKEINSDFFFGEMLGIDLERNQPQGEQEILGENAE